MKFPYLVLIVVVILIALAGCNGVNLSPKYSQLLDETAALSNDTATKAEAGVLTSDQKTTSLRGQATVWQEFRDGRDGKATP